MDKHWAFAYLPKVFCGFSYIVNPVFIYLIFSEKSSVLGNYRYLLLYFACFNLFYSVANVLVPLDIHSYGYCFFLMLSDGYFVQLSDFNIHILIARCALIICSYAVLMSHFVYRYLVVLSSSLTKQKFPLFMLASFALLVLMFGSWHTLCITIGTANHEMREYIRNDFMEIYGKDSMDFNMMGALYRDGSWDTVSRSWLAVSLWSLGATWPIFGYAILCRLIIKKLKTTTAMSCRTAQIQIELLRALVVQTMIPIFISFLPAVLCWYTPMIGVQLGRTFNYFEVSAFGVFAFVDPIAIILCIPLFRKRLFGKWMVPNMHPRLSVVSTQSSKMATSSF